jgi:hypothetical protein
MESDRAGQSTGRSPLAGAGAISAADTPVRPAVQHNRSHTPDRTKSDLAAPDRARPAAPPPEIPFSDALSRRLASATCEPNIRAVAITLCRQWGDDPDEMISVCDRAGRATGSFVAKWSLFRGEAMAAITAFFVAEDETGEPLEIPAFLSAAARRAG